MLSTLMLLALLGGAAALTFTGLVPAVRQHGWRVGLRRFGVALAGLGAGIAKTVAHNILDRSTGFAALSWFERVNENARETTDSFDPEAMTEAHKKITESEEDEIIKGPDGHTYAEPFAVVHDMSHEHCIDRVVPHDFERVDR